MLLETSFSSTSASSTGGAAGAAAGVPAPSGARANFASKQQSLLLASGGPLRNPIDRRTLSSSSPMRPARPRRPFIATQLSISSLRLSASAKDVVMLRTSSMKLPGPPMMSRR